MPCLIFSVYYVLEGAWSIGSMANSLEPVLDVTSGCTTVRQLLRR